MTLDELYKIIEDRKNNPRPDSYVAALFARGSDRIIQKVGEEAVEVVIAAKNQDKKEVVNETADLLFHLTVMLAQLGVSPADIMQELDKRHRAS